MLFRFPLPLRRGETGDTLPFPDPLSVGGSKEMAMEPFTSTTRSAFRRKLLAWFDRARRDLPWRATRDPYRIWVSEVMLQQTTVAAVIPFYERFLERFPTVQTLAAADEQTVLHHWQGLGYYRRARHLHAAARQLVAEHGGALPDDPAVWADLPGVGRYILGAVLSQAFDRRLPIVEANTLRVLSRLFGSRLDPRAGEGKAWVWRAATEVLPRKRAGDFNQAMMELGALVCTPVAPACEVCPVRRHCEAFALGLQAVIPPPTKRVELTTEFHTALIVRREGRVLICQRPASAGRGAMLWEFPTIVGEPSEQIVGTTVALGTELLTVHHGVTRFRITLTGIGAEWRSGEFASDFYAAGLWVTGAELADYPMSNPQGKLRAEWTKSAKQGRLW